MQETRSLDSRDLIAADRGDTDALDRWIGGFRKELVDAILAAVLEILESEDAHRPGGLRPLPSNVDELQELADGFRQHHIATTRNGMDELGWADLDQYLDSKCYSWEKGYEDDRFRVLWEMVEYPNLKGLVDRLCNEIDAKEKLESA